jgi:hypothetical protein
MSVGLLLPPGGLDELSSEQSRAWDSFVRARFDTTIGYLQSIFDPPGQDQTATVAEPPSGPLQFATPDEPPTLAVSAQRIRRQIISWPGFPRALTLARARDEALAEAEELVTAGTRDEAVLVTKAGEPFPIRYRRQDEYLEWRVERDEQGRIERVLLTSESPEYWCTLADGMPPAFYRRPAQAPQLSDALGVPARDLLLERYHRLVGKAVRLEDLFFPEDLYDPEAAADPRARPVFTKGAYNPWNRWNTTDGLVHLQHPANTLGAEIQVVGDGTVLRRDAMGRLVQAPRRLICFAGSGDVKRNSDVVIGAAVNELARAGARVTLANPVALYMTNLHDTGWTRPDGSPIGDWWKVLRGRRGRALRAVFEVPEGETLEEDGRRRQLRVSDLLIGREPIRYGGQIAEAFAVGLEVEAWDLGAEPFRALGRDRQYRCCQNLHWAELLQIIGETGESDLRPCAYGFRDAFPDSAPAGGSRRAAAVARLIPSARPGPNRLGR